MIISYEINILYCIGLHTFSMSDWLAMLGCYAIYI